MVVPRKYSFQTNFNNNLSARNRFACFFLDFGNEFYWYITRVRESNQLTHKKIKKGSIFESFSSNK